MTKDIGAHAAPSAKAAALGFVSEFSRFQDRLKAKLEKQEKRLNMLEHHSATLNRPALSAANDLGAP
ncbi:MAG: phage major capsid protein, partial [Pseudomonadota bacterium]